MYYQYIVKVPISGEMLAMKDTIIDRIEYYNDSRNYLLFDGGTETEKRFILVTEKRISKDKMKDIYDIFETDVTLEPINIKNVERNILKKIHIAKKLMTKNNYCGDQKTMLITDTADQLMNKVNSMIGFTKFKEFYKKFAEYTDHTSGLTAKCMYNIVLVNNCSLCLDAHIELLYGLFAAKGLLNEHVMIY